MRNTIFRQTDHFHLSVATNLDVATCTLHCSSVLKSDLEYSLQYDKLVIGVGAVSNTFGVPGVAEHAFFLKVVKEKSCAVPEVHASTVWLDIQQFCVFV